MQISISKTDLKAIVSHLGDYIAQGSEKALSTSQRNRIRMALVLKRKLEKKLSS